VEDGDRAEALGELGKVEVVIDLNPMSRSARAADVPIVDNVIRAVPSITEHARELADADRETLEGIVAEFDAEEALAAAERAIREGGDGDDGA